MAERLITVGNVGVFGVGGSNARKVVNHTSGELGEAVIEPTPTDRAEFMAWLARGMRELHEEQGCRDIFTGMPGPVKQKGASTEVGPMVNTTFLRQGTFILEREMAKVDPGLGRQMENGDFRYLAGNDGDLAAAAGAHFCGRGEHCVSGVIEGTGIGTGTLNALAASCFSGSIAMYFRQCIEAAQVCANLATTQLALTPILRMRRNTAARH